MVSKNVMLLVQKANTIKLAVDDLRKVLNHHRENPDSNSDDWYKNDIQLVCKYTRANRDWVQARNAAIEAIAEEAGLK